MKYKELLKEERDRRDLVRIANLQELVARYGSVKALAVAVSRSPAQIGNMLRRVQPFGDAMRDHIEKELELEPGFLDRAPGTYTQQEIEDAANSISTMSNCISINVDAKLDLKGDKTFIEVTSDEMKPEFKTGDRLIVDRGADPKPGDIVLCECGPIGRIAGFYEIKSFDPAGNIVYRVKPANTSYPALESDVNPLRLVGVVKTAIKNY